MEDKRVLIISSEVVPYLQQKNLAMSSFRLSRSINSGGGQTRIFMPRYGLINERRHQLHEVIRLSGMNLAINDMSMPLVVKVASIPKERIQVYFIDNEEYFKRKALLHNKNGKLFPDNDERMIFFTKGVVETVKKLNWSPSIIHFHGWFTALFPLYFKTYYKNEPLFNESNLITSIYNDKFEGTLSNDLQDKLIFDGITKKESTLIENPDYFNLTQISIQYSDGIVISEQQVDDTIIQKIENSGKPFLSYEQGAGENACLDFYSKNFSQTPV